MSISSQGRNTHQRRNHRAMGRSKQSLKRKRPSRSKDSGFYAKRHSSSTNCSTATSKIDGASQSTTNSSQKSFYNVVTYTQVPYYSWLTYFYNQDFSEASPTVTKINALIEFFEKNLPASNDVEVGFDLDIKRCIDDSALQKKWPNIIQDINVNPHHTLKCLNSAFIEVIMRQAMTGKFFNVEQVFRFLRLNRINLINYQSLSPLTEVTLSSYGKLISIGGTVIGMGGSKLSLDSIVYVCKCGRQLFYKPRKDTILMPKKCNVCGNARIKRLVDSPYELTKISQMIYVKDLRKFDQIGDDSTISPNIVSVKLWSNFVEKFLPGDKIRLIGIPRVKLGASKSAISGSCPLYVDAISVLKDNDITSENADLPINRIFIERIKSEPDVLSLLVHSLCPSVLGHEIIKASLILGLFAGTLKSEDTRDYIHILIIGNMGLGKSQLLRCCSQVAPKGVYIRGSSTTNLGSKMITFRDNLTDDYRFDAGPLALNNRGLCCIDELEKMSNQHQIIYNAMIGQQVIMINPELNIRLPAQTSIFAMTNSTKKHYDSAKTVLENVNSSKQLLSQFDLIFLMRDNPDAYLDQLMCDRLLDEHKKRTNPGEFFDRRNIGEPRTHFDTLRERLVTPNESTSDILPQHLFRMYVSYARIFVEPKLSDPSKAIIEKFCLLKHEKERDFMKIERLLRTLMILTKARAKIDLCDETSEQDAFDAVEIFTHSMAIDTKDVSQSSSSNNSTKLTANKVKQFLNDLRKEAEYLKKSIFTVEELRKIAGQENVEGYNLSTLLSKLNEQGYLLKLSANAYKVVFHQA